MSGNGGVGTRNNYGCFTGIGLSYWRDLARGLQPQIVRNRSGSHLEYGKDAKEFSDGFAANNGGIISPTQDWLGRGKLYFRFFSADAHSRYGKNGWHGHWWVGQDVFSALRSEAVENGESLRVVASCRLALPLAWNDVRYVVCATPITNLKAWVGRGKVAHTTTSPASKQRQRHWESSNQKTAAKPKSQSEAKPDMGLYGDTPELSLRQLFVPGDVRAGVFGEFFHPLGVGRVFDMEDLKFDFGRGRDNVKWPGAKRGAQVMKS